MSIHFNKKQLPISVIEGLPEIPHEESDSSQYVEELFN